MLHLNSDIDGYDILFLEVKKLSQTLEATFDGQVFRPVQPVELEPDTQVEIVVTVKVSPEEKSKSFLRTASSLKLKGPKDFSSRIDDYL